MHAQVMGQRAMSAKALSSGIFIPWPGKGVSIDVTAQLPPLTDPIASCGLIVLQYIQMTLAYAKAFETENAAFHKPAGDSPMTVLRNYQQMLEITTTPVVSAHDAPADDRPVLGNETQAGVSQQIPCRCLQ